MQGVDFGAELTIAVTLSPSRFAYPGVPVPRVRLPDGSVRLVEPDWMGKLDGFTLLFEALVLTLCREMTFAAVARLVNLSWYRVKAISDRYVDLAVAATDLSDVTAVAIDETSCRRGHDYVSLVADMDERRVVFVAACKDAGVVERFANHLEEHNATPAQIQSVSCNQRPVSGCQAQGARIRQLQNYANRAVSSSPASSTSRPSNPHGLVCRITHCIFKRA